MAHAVQDWAWACMARIYIRRLLFPHLEVASSPFSPIPTQGSQSNCDLAIKFLPCYLDSVDPRLIYAATPLPPSANVTFQAPPIPPGITSIHRSTTVWLTQLLPTQTFPHASTNKPTQNHAQPVPGAQSHYLSNPILEINTPAFSEEAPSLRVSPSFSPSTPHPRSQTPPPPLTLSFHLIDSPAQIDASL